jgi:hypothetical protein
VRALSRPWTWRSPALPSPETTGGPGADEAGPAGRPYAWLAGPVAAVLLVAWGASVNLGRTSSVVQAAAVAALFSGSCVLALTPGVALLSVVARRRRLGPATGLGLLFTGAGAAAMAGLWAWFASPLVGRVFALVLLVVSVAAIGVFGRRGELRRLGLSTPLLLALAVGLAFTGLAFLQGGIASIRPTEAIETRFWAKSDNILPLLFASRIAAHLPLSGYMEGEWLFSDRPPLQTGFVLLQWPLWGAKQQLGYQLLSTGLQVSWLPALWTLLRVRGLGAGRVSVVVLMTAATGAVFFNTVYDWPKMLAGALALTALAILVSLDDGDQWAGAGILVTATVVLSLLAHGATAFAVIALVPFTLPLRRRITVRSVAAAAAAAIVLYLPWTLFQHLVAPPGDRLIKWQLAGVVPVTQESVLDTLVHQYLALSLHQLLVNKWDNVTALVAASTLWHTQKAASTWTTGSLGLARLAQLYDVLPAAGLLLLGLLALLFPSGRRVLAPARPLAIFTGLAVLVWSIMEWGGSVKPEWGGAITAILYAGPYAAVILILGLCALAVTALPWPFASAIATASAAWFALCWLPGLGFHPGTNKPGATVPLDDAMLVVYVGGLVLVGLCVAYDVRDACLRRLTLRCERESAGRTRSATPGAAAQGGGRPPGYGCHHGRLGDRVRGRAHRPALAARRRPLVGVDVRLRPRHGPVRAVVRALPQTAPGPAGGPPWSALRCL